MNRKISLAFEGWFKALPSHPAAGGPARGTIAAALVVLEHLRENCRLNLSSHQAKGKAQLAGVSPAAVAKILARFGETRPFLKEGGRTNRGGPGAIGGMLDSLRAGGIEKFDAATRESILTSLQSFLVDRVKDFHDKQRLKVLFDPSKATWCLISELLCLARQNGKEAPVAQYLVGAKLALRFPNLKVENFSYSTADDQLGRPGDFYVSDTAFHVTVAPQMALFEKCRTNLDQGYRVYLLVPERAVIGARQNAEAHMAGKMAVESIESFVGNNVEELSEFSKDKLRAGFTRLFEEYNRRVDAVENDKSLLLEIPPNLL
jgi:hypothetical protein